MLPPLKYTPTIAASTRWVRRGYRGTTRLDHSVVAPFSFFNRARGVSRRPQARRQRPCPCPVPVPATLLTDSFVSTSSHRQQDFLFERVFHFSTRIIQTRPLTP